MQSYLSQKERDSGVIPVLQHGSEWEADPAQGYTLPAGRLSEGLHRGGASMAEHLRSIHSKKDYHGTRPKEDDHKSKKQKECHPESYDLEKDQTVRYVHTIDDKVVEETKWYSGAWNEQKKQVWAQQKPKKSHLAKRSHKRRKLGRKVKPVNKPVKFGPVNERKENPNFEERHRMEQYRNLKTSMRSLREINLIIEREKERNNANRDSQRKELMRFRSAESEKRKLAKELEEQRVCEQEAIKKKLYESSQYKYWRIPQQDHFKDTTIPRGRWAKQIKLRAENIFKRQCVESDRKLLQEEDEKLRANLRRNKQLNEERDRLLNVEKWRKYFEDIKTKRENKRLRTEIQREIRMQSEAIEKKKYVDSKKRKIKN